MLESRFKTRLIKNIKKRLPGCMILHLDPNEIQGIPDLIILYKKRWGVLEGKRSDVSPIQPNQEYYINLMNNMSFGAFISPETEEEILDELQRSLRSRR